MGRNENNKTMIYAGVGVCVALVIGLIVFFATRGGGEQGGTSDNGGSGSNTSSQTTTGFDNPEVEIVFGDYDAMYTLSKSIQN